MDQLKDDIRDFSQKDGSHLEMLLMKKYQGVKLGTTHSLDMGIFEMLKTFSVKGNARDMMSSVLRSLQMSYKMGRFSNLQSAFFPVTPNREFDILYNNVELGRERLAEKKSTKVVRWHEGDKHL